MTEAVATDTDHTKAAPNSAGVTVVSSSPVTISLSGTKNHSQRETGDQKAHNKHVPDPQSSATVPDEKKAAPPAAAGTDLLSMATAPATPPVTVALADRVTEQSRKLFRQMALSAAGVNDLTISIDNFSKVIANTELKYVKEDLSQFYKTYRKVVLKDTGVIPQDMTWIYNYGDEPENQLHLPVGQIYLHATKVAEEAKLNNSGSRARPGDKKAILPDTILLHLYRLFNEVEDDSAGKIKLVNMISTLEDRLGIVRPEAKVSGPSINFNGADQMRMLTAFPQIATSIFNDPSASSTFKSIEDSLANVTDIGTAVQTIMGFATNPQLSSVIQKHLGSHLPLPPQQAGQGASPRSN